MCEAVNITDSARAAIKYLPVAALILPQCPFLFVKLKDLTVGEAEVFQCLSDEINATHLIKIPHAGFIRHSYIGHVGAETAYELLCFYLEYLLDKDPTFPVSEK